MPNALTHPDPRDFGLASFAELLTSRAPMPGEDPHSFDTFRRGLLASLTPATAYECVVAESLVAIEWELLQRRRMREASLRKTISEAILKSAMSCARAIHNAEVDKARDEDWDEFIAAGGDGEEWDDPYPFDQDAAEERVAKLVDEVLSNIATTQAAAHKALTEMGVDLIGLMGAAYAQTFGEAVRHDTKTQELERRRREVRRDYDAILSARPIEHEGNRGDIPDAEVVSQ
jgi:hypothetical protein